MEGQQIVQACVAQAQTAVRLDQEKKWGEAMAAYEATISTLEKMAAGIADCIASSSLLPPSFLVVSCDCPFIFRDFEGSIIRTFITEKAYTEINTLST
tara:strand:- start:350 stop:643 length:294 start_codon:yes stop_codon:yes gene_type:complete